MDMKAVKLSELVEVIEFDSEEYGAWVDTQNGSVVQVSHSLISAVEDNDEDALETLPDWEKEEVKIAKAIVEDSGKRFLDAPSKFDFHEYQHMERFIGTVEDNAVADQLWRSIKGKGAFRRFKDTAQRLGLLKKWYDYREDAMKEFVLDWAVVKEIPVLDDVKRKPQP